MLSLLHAPPRALGASASRVTGPPAAEILRSLPLEKKAMNFPSCDQNGEEDPSVPASFSAVELSSRRTQMEFPCLPVRAANAMRVPSGESTGGPEKSPMKSNPASGGGIIEARITRDCGRGERANHSSRLSRSASPATHQARSRHRGCG